MFYYFFNVYLLLERQNMSRKGTEREGDTESKAGSRLWAVSPETDTGLKLVNHKIMTLAEVGCLTEWATQVSLKSMFQITIVVLPGWLSWLNVWLLILAQVMILRFMRVSCTLGPALTVQSLLGILSFPLSLCTPNAK